MEWGALAHLGMCALFLAHEMDASARGEWRMLPLLGRLDDAAARDTFVALHVPLILMLMSLGVADPGSTAAATLSAFAVVHVAIHWLLRRHPANAMNNAFSWGLLAACGACGALHLAWRAGLGET